MQELLNGQAIPPVIPSDPNEPPELITIPKSEFDFFIRYNKELMAKVVDEKAKKSALCNYFHKELDNNKRLETHNIALACLSAVLAVALVIVSMYA